LVLEIVLVEGGAFGDFSTNAFEALVAVLSEIRETSLFLDECGLADQFGNFRSVVE
jgi:hypothetical protein